MSIIDLFLGLDRAGPGDGESLAWALQVAGTPPGAPVLDAGCGVGADTGVLLAAGMQVTALDAAEPFVEQVRARHPAAQAICGDMGAPPAGPWALIWSAGAVYNLGVTRALEAWRPVLAPGGRVAFSDLRWTNDTSPAAARDFWASQGVSLTGAAALRAEVGAAGWRVLGERWLGSAGWAAYYEPLERALDAFGEPELVAAFRDEIACWRANGDSYDYRLIVAEPA